MTVPADGRRTVRIVSLTPLFQPVDAVRAAGVHLAADPSRGCGCPAWEAAVDPSAAPVRHDRACPLLALDDVFRSMSKVTEALVSVKREGTTVEQGEQVLRRLRDLGEDICVEASVGYALVLAALSRLHLQLDATRDLRQSDLNNSVVERYATVTRISTDPSIPLGAETVVRMLLCDSPASQLSRTIDLLGVNASSLGDDPIATVTAVCFTAVSQEKQKLLAELPADPMLEDGLELTALASEGFNLMAGITHAGEVVPA